MNQQDIQKVLTILRPVWPTNGLDKALIPAWTLALQDQDSGLLQAAAADWIRTEKWFPKPSELIALAGDIAAEQMRTGQRALPAPKASMSPAEQLATLRRCVAKAEQFGITLNPQVHNRIAALESEMAA